MQTSNKTIAIDGLMRAKETAKILSVSVGYVYRLEAAGKLPSVRWRCLDAKGKKQTVIRFEPEQIRLFIEAHRAK